MKTFIASLSIILVIIAFTVTSGLYVKNVTDKLLDLEAQFPEKEDGESSPSAAITESEELLSSSYWKLTSLSHTKLANNVKTALSHLTSCYRHGTYADYMSARTSYVEALKSLRQIELPSFKGII